MKLDSWSGRCEELGSDGELWVDVEGVHFTGGLFVDYVDIFALEASGDRLRVRSYDENDQERVLTFSRSEGEAEVVRARLAALQAEYTEPDVDQATEGGGEEPEAAADDELQFDQAEFEGERLSAATCAACQKGIEATYFEINGAVACSACKVALDASLSPVGGGRRFLKALTLGVLAAVLGAGIYFGVAALTGYEIGLVAIVVGLLVGGGVRLGSEHRGGAGYQALAIVLTYLAIVATYVPPIVRGADATIQEAQSKTAEAPKAKAAEGAVARPGATETKFERSFVFWIFVLVLAFIWPFAALFVEGASQILGLLIVGFAIYEAWKLNKRPKITVTGPFTLGAVQPAPSDGL